MFTVQKAAAMQLALAGSSLMYLPLLALLATKLVVGGLGWAAAGGVMPSSGTRL